MVEACLEFADQLYRWVVEVLGAYFVFVGVFAMVILEKRVGAV